MMATTTKAEAVKENQIIKTDYAELIANGLDNNSQGQQFVQLVAHEMASGTTISEVKASMKSLLKDINIKPIIFQLMPRLSLPLP
jgi:hypothetical protein